MSRYHRCFPALPCAHYKCEKDQKADEWQYGLSMDVFLPTNQQIPSHLKTISWIGYLHLKVTFGENSDFASFIVMSLLSLVVFQYFLAYLAVLCHCSRTCASFIQIPPPPIICILTDLLGNTFFSLYIFDKVNKWISCCLFCWIITVGFCLFHKYLWAFY